MSARAHAEGGAPDWDMASWFDAFGSERYAAFRRELEDELRGLEEHFGDEARVEGTP